MSFGSGSTQALPAPAQKPLGLDTVRLATVQEARPVPVIHGQYAVGITFLSQVFDRKVDQQTEDAGKKTVVVGYHYRGSFAAALCNGIVDRIETIAFDGDIVWGGVGTTPINRDTTVDKLVSVRVIDPGTGYPSNTTVTTIGGATLRPVVKDGQITEVIVDHQGSGFDPAHPPTNVGMSPAITIIGSGGSGATLQGVIGSETFVEIDFDYLTMPCHWRFYWGMPYGDYDPLLLTLSGTGRNPNADGVEGDNVPEEHPAYIGLCYLVSENQYIGYNKTQVANIEVVVASFPKNTWMSPAIELNGDCNPIAAIAEDLTNQRYGLGLDLSRLDTTGMDATAAVLDTEGMGISEIVTEALELREHLTRILEHLYGYWTTTPEGKFTVGLIREEECTPEDPNTPYFDETCLVQRPKLDPVSWDGTFNQVYVAYKNRFNKWNDDAIPANNVANFMITGEPRMQSLQRPYFTRPDLAEAYASAAVQIASLPLQSGKIVVRKSRLQGATVGGIFKLSYGHYGLCYLWCRINQITIANPYQPEAEILFELDRGYLTQATYTPPVYAPPVAIKHLVQLITAQRLIEMPYVDGLANAEAPTMGALAARPTSFTTQFDIVQIDGGTGTRLKSTQAFAYHGTLDADYTVADTTLALTLDRADTALAPFSASAADLWLLVIDDEILSVTDAAMSGSAAQYTLSVIRERFDTKRQAHAASTECFLIQEAVFADAIFARKGSSDPGDVESVKLQPFVLGDGADLSLVTAISETFSDRSKRWWKPRNLTAMGTTWFNGDASYSTGNDIAVSWVPVSRLGSDASGPRFEENLQNLWYLELRDTEDNVKDTQTFAGKASSFTWTNAALQAAFSGSEPAAFKVRIYAQQYLDETTPLPSRTYDEITVNKA